MSISAINASSALAASVASRPGDTAPSAAGIMNAAEAPKAAVKVLPMIDAPGTAVSEIRQAEPPGIQQALDEVREALAPVAQNLLFSLDEDSGRTVIKIVDSTTDEVIKQIPSEEILAIAKALDKLQGVLIRQQA